MEYWQGYMNWKMEEGWRCEVCGSRELIWGLIHAQCRCITCHSEYRMRDETDKVVTKPICQLKPEYHKAARLGWEKLKKPISEFTDNEWDELIKIAKEK